MIYERLFEFRFLRDISIASIVRHRNIPLQQVLMFKKDNTSALHFSEDYPFQKYLGCLNFIFPNSEWLFPTDDGHLYLPVKFNQNIRRYLAQQKMPVSPNHPRKMSAEQFKAILSLRFKYQRPSLQQLLAAALLGYEALRPEEVANLVKEDINFENQTIYLKHTKGQESQNMPIHIDLLYPLKAYLDNLEVGEALFKRQSGKTWGRKEVHHAVEQLGNLYGIEHVNPRRLRSTVAHEMLSSGVPINVISELLRHKDKATAPRHYTAFNNIAIVRQTMNEFRPTQDKNVGAQLPVE